jgi:DNA mismatch repair protein MSH3
LQAGVPAHRIEWHLRRLVAAGHKVGVVRQVETRAIRAAGGASRAPFERRLTAVYTRATLEAGELAAERPPTKAAARAAAAQPGDADEADEEPAGAGAPAAWSSEQRSAYLLAVVEEPLGAAGAARHGAAAAEVGVVAVETSTGDVLYAQFIDDGMRAGLEARLLYAVPAEILVAAPVGAPTARLLKAHADRHVGVRAEEARGERYRGGGAAAAVAVFYGGGDAAEGAAAADAAGAGAPPPPALAAALALPPLVLRALAHALDHLRPFGLEAVLRAAPAFREFSAARELALSPNALEQLEVLRNSADGRERGSLIWLLDRTTTPAGSRLLRHWVTRPLRDVPAIEERLDAVEELVGAGGDGNSAGNAAAAPALAALPELLRALPDLERALTRALHGTSSPLELLRVLRLFADLHARLGLAADLDAADSSAPPALAPPRGVRSALLVRLLLAAGDLRCAAAARASLASIDADAAAANDRLALCADDARFPEVASRRAGVAAAEAALAALLPELAKELGVRSVEYVSLNNQGDYLVQAPAALDARAPRAWERVSKTQKFVRFRPPAVRRTLAALELAREHLAAAAAAAWRRLQAEFSEDLGSFRAAARALAALDCLASLASLAASAPGYVRPRFLPDDGAPAALRVEGGRHPVLEALLDGAFVPNDARLGGGAGAPGGAAPPVLVVTGPNMGGKSCFSRQVALIALMAQAGSFVPATSATLAAFDAIFTRMGAADNLAAGRSTFLEELAEAAAILRAATPRSLVLIDELGRGTSTADGVAVAHATLAHLAGSLRAPALFITHYPEVAALAAEMPEAARCVHMDFVVEGAGEAGAGAAGATGAAAASAVAAAPRVRFLYRLADGAAASSHGLNVARMAGLPPGVVARATAVAAAAEAAAEARGGGGGGGRAEAALGALARAARAALAEAAAGGGGTGLPALQARVRGLLEAAA